MHKLNYLLDWLFRNSKSQKEVSISLDIPIEIIQILSYNDNILAR